MKKKAIHVGVLAAIFIIAVVVFEYMTTRGNDDMMEDLAMPYYLGCILP
ncbi:hypothetical protein [Dorea sp. AM58-8]|nr:hypothetical protein [Dorea sp. AM58-8]